MQIKNLIAMQNYKNLIYYTYFITTNDDTKTIVEKNNLANKEQIVVLTNIFNQLKDNKEKEIQSIKEIEFNTWIKSQSVIEKITSHAIEFVKNNLKHLTKDKKKISEIEQLYSNGDLSEFKPQKIEEFINNIQTKNEEMKRDVIIDIYRNTNLLSAARVASKIQEINQIYKQFAQKYSNFLSKFCNSEKKFLVNDLTLEELLCTIDQENKEFEQYLDENGYPKKGRTESTKRETPDSEDEKTEQEGDSNKPESTETETPEGEGGNTNQGGDSQEIKSTETDDEGNNPKKVPLKKDKKTIKKTTIKKSSSSTQKPSTSSTKKNKQSRRRRSQSKPRSRNENENETEKEEEEEDDHE